MALATIRMSRSRRPSWSASPPSCRGRARATGRHPRRRKEHGPMDAYYFSEMAFHPAWEAGGNLLRNDIPSRLFDPVVGHQLLNRFLDEYALCDELGLNIMLNEHHSTATCTDVTCTLPLAILARQTK